MRRDVISAYVLTFARIASWVVVSAVVYRHLGAAAFATVALVRSTVGILSYASLGIGPAIIRLLSVAEKASPVLPVSPADAELTTAEPLTAILSYESAHVAPPPKEDVLTIYVTGEYVALALGASWSHCFRHLRSVVRDTPSRRQRALSERTRTDIWHRHLAPSYERSAECIASGSETHRTRQRFFRSR